MIIEGVIIKADKGKAIRRKVDVGPTKITRVSLSPDDSPDNWTDCEYGECEDATESDKDAALATLGVDMTDG